MVEVFMVSQPDFKFGVPVLTDRILTLWFVAFGSGDMVIVVALTV